MKYKITDKLEIEYSLHSPMPTHALIRACLHWDQANEAGLSVTETFAARTLIFLYELTSSSNSGLTKEMKFTVHRPDESDFSFNETLTKIAIEMRDYLEYAPFAGKDNPREYFSANVNHETLPDGEVRYINLEVMRNVENKEIKIFF